MEIKCNDLSLSFGQFPILQGVNFTLTDTSRVGIIGQNGAGKSTLLKLITGELTPDAGELFITRGTSIGFLKQNSGLSAERTIFEEMRSVFSRLLFCQEQMAKLQRQMAAVDPAGADYARMAADYAALNTEFEAGDGYTIDYRIRTVLFGMGFGEEDFPKEIYKMSGGEKTRLALAKLLLLGPQVLLLDEPTNHLDFTTLLWLENYLKGYKGCVVVVSHDRYFLDTTVTEILEVSRHRVKSYKGNYSRYKQLKEEELYAGSRAYEKQQKVIEKYEDYIQKNLVRASTSKMAKSRRKALEKMEVLEKPTEEKAVVRFTFPFDRPPFENVFSVKGVDVCVEGKALIRDVSFTVKRGEKACIVGENGAGKSTFLKQVLGMLPTLRGRIQTGGFVKIGYFEQEQNPFHPGETVLDALYNKYPGMTELELRSHLAAFAFTGEEIEKRVGELSGGELAKLKFANLSLQRPNVLVLDEPSNHLDLFAKEELQKALKAYEGTILMVSHDRYLLNDTADYIIEMSRSGVEITPGNFEAYRAKLEAREAASQAQEQEKKPAPKQEAGSYRSKEERRRAAQRREALSRVERAIEACEAEMAAQQAALADPDVQSDYQRLADITAALEALQSKLDGLMEEWETLESAQ